MKPYYLLPLSVLLLYSIASSQNDTLKLLKLADTLREEIYQSKFSDALRNIQSIRAVIEDLLQKKAQRELPASGPSRQFEEHFQQEESPAVIKLGSDDVRVHFGEKTLYVVDEDPNDQFASDYLFAVQLPVEYNNRLAIENKYIKLDGQTKTIVFKSLTPKIVTVGNDGTLRVYKPGNAVLRITIDDRFAEIYLKVIKIPLRRGMSKETIIKKLGLPDKQTKRHINWAESGLVDDIFYSPASDQVYGITVEHWQYDKYNGVIFRISILDALGYIIQKKWHDLPDLQYRLEHN